MQAFNENTYKKKQKTFHDPESVIIKTPAAADVRQAAIIACQPGLLQISHTKVESCLSNGHPSHLKSSDFVGI
jgi:hypothetical protein